MERIFENVENPKTNFQNVSIFESLVLENNIFTGLMITASHQTFSGQLWHLTDQTKFDQTNLLCIINGEVNKFTLGKQMSRQFSILIISTVFM